MSAHRIGQLPGPIDQHAAALASHAAASGQKIKKGFPQVLGKIGDRHVLVRPVGLAVSGCFKPGETDKPLILRGKSLSVSLFHRFQGEAAGNFQIGGPIPIKISRAVFRQNRETAKQRAISP